MRSFRSRALASAFAALSLFAPSALAVEAVWIGGPTGNWSDPANWSTQVVPNTDATNVAIDDGSLQDSAVVLDQDATIQNLVVDAGDSLHLDPSRTLTTSSVTIGGEVFLDAASQLEVSDYLLIEPGATLSLADEAQVVRASYFGLLPIWNRGRVEGAGGFQNVLTNEGTVVADIPSKTLQLGLYGTKSRGVHFNQGELVAENGGELRILGGTFFTPLENSNGMLEARGDSTVSVSTIRLVGGRVSTSSAGGVNEGEVSFVSTLFENVTLEGNVKLSSVTFGDRVINNTRQEDTEPNYFFVEGYATISGDGWLELNGGAINVPGGGYGGSLVGTPGFVNDVNHTIYGPGSINSSTYSVGLIFENRGLLETEEGTLQFNLRTVRSTSAASSINVGVIRARAGGRVEILGSSVNDTLTNRDATKMGLVEAGVDSTVKLGNMRLRGGVLRAVVSEEGSTSQPGTVVGAGALLEGVRLEGKIGDDNSNWLLTGEIENSDEFAGSWIRILGPTTLTGGGEIRLAGGPGIVADSSIIGSLINEDNLLRGEGRLGDRLTFQNRGVVQADVPDGTLSVEANYTYNSTSLVNSGEMKAINGGKLVIDGLIANHEGSDLGTIYAGDGSEVNVFHVEGGILDSSGTGKIVVTPYFSDTYLEGVENRGALIFDRGARLVGKIVNDGTVVQNSDTPVNLSGPVTELTGTGVWGTPDSPLAIEVGYSAPAIVEHGAQHTIQGGGTIRVRRGSLINHGTVIANGSTPLLITVDEGQSFEQQGSLIVADARTMEVQLNDERFVNHGVIDAAGTFQLTRMNEGVVEFRNVPGAELHVNPIFAVSSPTAAGYSVHLWNQAGALLAGHGNVNLYDAAVDQETLLLNSGILRPEGDTSPFGEISVSGNFQQDATGLLELELGGTSASGEFDALQISDGLAMLGGTLDLFLVGGYDPSVGDSFDILTNLDGQIQGSFNTVNAPALADRWWSLEYLSDRVVLSVEAITADFDGNGIVDSQDLDRWRSSYGVDALCDADGDGDSDGFDLLAWQRQRGSGVELGAGVAVPEPTALVLSLLGIAVLMTLRTCSKTQAGFHCWLVQQCEAGTRHPLLDKISSGTRTSTNNSHFGRTLASSIAALILLVPSSRADEAVWIGGTSSKWSDPANWSTGAVPNDAMTNVTIDGDPLLASMVNLDQDATVGNVIVESGDALGLDHGSVGNVNSVAIAGDIHLAGASQLHVNDYLLVQPAGTLTLAGGAQAIQNSSAQMWNRGRIEGAGLFSFSYTSWRNEGILTANVPEMQLRMNHSYVDQTFNSGELIAENGGILVISNIHLENSDGIIEARGDSTVTFSGRIVGGRVSTSAVGGTSDGTVTLKPYTYLENVSLEGNVKLDYVVFNGRTTNNTQLLGVDSKVFFVDGYATFTGTGSLELNGGELNAAGNNNPETPGFVNEFSHTIQGPGAISSTSGLVFDNRGVIETSEGTLSVRLSTNSHSGLETSTNSGIIRATSGGQVEILGESFRYGLNNFSGSTNGLIEAGVDSTIMLGRTRIWGGVLRAVAPEEGSASLPGKIVASTNPSLSGLTLEGVRLEGAIGDAELGSVWNLAGTIENTGSLTGQISIIEPTTLTGGGEMILRSGLSSSPFSSSGSSFFDPLINQDNVIRCGSGYCSLGQFLAFTNRGTVQADSPNTYLHIKDNSISSNLVPFFNSGEIKAINGGNLTIEAPIVNYEGTDLGTIHAGDGSEITITHVEGGILSTDETGKIVLSSGYASNVHIKGSLDSIYRSELHGTITNDGRITNRWDTHFVDFTGGFAELTGRGEWGGPNAPVAIHIGSYRQPTVFKQGPEHTIQGRGTIEVVEGTFINRGTVIADGSSPLYIKLDQGMTMQQRGTLVVDGPGTMEVRVYGELFQNRGTIEAAGTFRLMRLNQYPGGSVEFRNEPGAELYVNSQFDVALSSSNDNTVGFWNRDDALVAGHGEMNLFSNYGNYDTLFKNSGTLRPEGADNPFGEISISGNFQQDTTGLLELELGGTAGGQFDAVHVTDGIVTLGGILDVSLAGGYDPSIGDSFDILTNLEGEVRDRFESFTAPALAGRWWSLAYLTDRVVLSVNAITADFDGNGIVDHQDLDDWQTAYGVDATGDTDGDGDTDGQDWLAWQRQLGSGIEVGAAQAVPEPASLWLVLMAVGVSVLAARNTA